MWTDKHDNFCLENKISGAAALLWRWLQSQAEGGEECEPDLNEFNKWVEKSRGKPFHRDTLKNAIARLAELRVIHILRTFSWRIHRLVVRPLDWLKPRKKSRSRNQNRDLPPSNPNSTVEQVKQQQHLSEESPLQEVTQVCREAGIVFRPKEWAKVVTYSLEDIKRALHHFQVRGGHAKIGNPSGWFLSCLKDQWWLDQAAYSDYHIGGLFDWIFGQIDGGSYPY